MDILGEGWGVTWELKDFIEAHRAVKASGVFNFEGCRIPIPTPIRYDRIRESLGPEASPKELRVLKLLEFGFPIDCCSRFGIQKVQKNHHSAVCHKAAIEAYIEKGIQSKAILGPFKEQPIADLCFSPLMSVPKEETSRRVIMDFSFRRARQ